MYTRRLTLAEGSNQLMVGDLPMALTPAERRLVKALLHQTNTLVGSDVLLSAVWPGDPKKDADNLRPLVKDVRDKLALHGARHLLASGPKGTGSYLMRDELSGAVPVEAPLAAARVVTVRQFLVHASTQGSVSAHTTLYVQSRSALEAASVEFVLENLRCGVRYVFRFSQADELELIRLLLCLVLGSTSVRDPKVWKERANLIAAGVEIEMVQQPLPLEYVALLDPLGSRQRELWITIGSDALACDTRPESTGGFRRHWSGISQRLSDLGWIHVEPEMDGPALVQRLRKQLANELRLPEGDAVIQAIFGQKDVPRIGASGDVGKLQEHAGTVGD